MKFADALRMFARARDGEGRRRLQTDLDGLSRWKDTGHITFNVQQCMLMDICARNKFYNNYFLGGGGQDMMTIGEERDLCIILR